MIRMNNAFISRKIVLIILCLASVSCAKFAKKEVKPKPRVYDSKVEDEFSSIENDQREVLEYYRRLRSQDWENYKRKYKPKRVSRPTRRGNRPTVKSYRPRPYQAPPAPKKKVIKRASLPDEQIEEMKIEMRQHMDYFCMQMRNSPRFSDTADCLAFTENIYSNCSASFPVIYDRGLVKCVRGKLR